ncbi:MAG TPA: hypothetical protein VFP13_08310 [Actinomycetota bacterium]|nr:hypothetical protein [Actinomycetota bacterium]
MTRRPCALVVSGDLEATEQWMAWLRGAGHRTLGCVGPLRTHTCPHTIGRRCPLRDASDLTIVDAIADPSGTCSGIGRQPCVMLGPSDGSTLDRRTFDERIRTMAGVARSMIPR